MCHYNFIPTFRRLVCFSNSTRCLVLFIFCSYSIHILFYSYFIFYSYSNSLLSSLIHILHYSILSSFSHIQFCSFQMLHIVQTCIHHRRTIPLSSLKPDLSYTRQSKVGLINPLRNITSQQYCTRRNII